MSSRQVGIGAPVKATYPSTSGSPNAGSVIKDGVVTSLFVACSAIVGTSFYTAQFSPVETGVYDLIIDDTLVATIEVVSRDIFSFLGNIEDQALGSWEWNKTTQVMTLTRQDGSLLGTYTTDDTLEAAYSRLVVAP